jgi:hypothetical protein
MKAWFAAIVAAWLCAGCAHGGATSAGEGGGSGSITMYGTIDQGVTFRK